MRTILIALAALASAGAAQAQTPADPHAGHAMPAAAPAATGKLSTSSPIVDLMANPAAKAVVDKSVPDIAAHPSYEMFKNMSLRDVAPMSEGVVTDEILTKLDAELAKLPAA